MTDRPLPPDAVHRETIRSALDRNLLVEAGAGSGKTTALVDRMLRLVAHGSATVDEIAAVTFTRKAAGELRQRFQERLEEALGEGALDAGGPPLDLDRTARLRDALDGIDRAFMGTIHAFCARLLRERPLDARLDPGFRELTAPEERTLALRFWNDHLERLASDDDGLLAELDAVGLAPGRLFEQFKALNEASDVVFPSISAPPPDPGTRARVRRALDGILDDAARWMPREEPERGWDWLQGKVRWIRYLRDVRDFDRTVDFMEAVETLCSSRAAKVTQNRWPDKARAKELRDRVNDLVEETDEGPERPARRLRTEWRAHRYDPAMALVRDASRAFALHRRRTGQLTFHDLLVLSRDLLRRSPAARGALGTRYRRILVDEFQDTDPLQAELLFLLASDPDDDPEGAVEGGWIDLRPRPGALFVVGDPKQSIYRFRRADIALYGRVRARFADFGQVVPLTANFRSAPAMGEIVAAVFGPGEAGGDRGGGLFPAEATEAQAAYAPLDTQPRTAPPPREGVFHYRIPEDRVGRASELVAWESAALARWIEERIAEGRAPEDFLVLTRTRKHVAAYARALEGRSIPVSVSGSGVGIDAELRELRILLEALADPGDPVKTVAALEGLFFGLDPDALLTHVEAGGAVDLRRERQPDGPVGEALATLRGWWMSARSRPADEVVERIVASVGLVPWAAAGELGALRAGALAFTLDLIRTATVTDDASLAGALEALALVLDDDDTDVEAPLEPGRGRAVRVMNLHKAKGLEAPVVILACPTGRVPEGRSMVVERTEGGASEGWCAVEERSSSSMRWAPTTILAAPRDWERRAARELLFERAEEDRLLYVAVTRAADELVVGMKAGDGADRGPWEKLEPWLRARSTELELAPGPERTRPPLGVDPADLRRREAEVEARRRDAGHPAWSFDTVTALTRAEDPPTPPAGDDLFSAAGLVVGPGPTVEVDTAEGWGQSLNDSTGPGGFAWGNAVHATLEAALQGPDGATLAGMARTALLENDRPVDRTSGEPVELEALLVLVDRLRGSEIWRRARDAETLLTEQPFVLERGNGTFLEGVIDLAFREADGWVIVDYKTAADDRVFELRLPRYRRQVELYAEAWTRLTGGRVKEARVWRVG